MAPSTIRKNIEETLEEVLESYSEKKHKEKREQQKKNEEKNMCGTYQSDAPNASEPREMNGRMWFFLVRRTEQKRESQKK